MGSFIAPCTTWSSRGHGKQHRDHPVVPKVRLFSFSSPIVLYLFSRLSWSSTRAFRTFVPPHQNRIPITVDGTLPSSSSLFFLSCPTSSEELTSISSSRTFLSPPTILSQHPYTSSPARHSSLRLECTDGFRKRVGRRRQSLDDKPSV